MKRTAPSLGVLILSSLMCVSTAEPCDQVVVYTPPRQALSHFNYVFVGRVERSHGHSAWTVDPVRVWKGEWPGDAHQFRVENRQGMCGTTVAVGEYYLFYMQEEGGDIGVARSLRDTRTRDDVGALDRARKRPPLRLPEEALTAPASRLVDPDCVRKWYLPPEVEADIAGVDSILIGRLATAPVLGESHDTDLLVSSTIKGRHARSISVHVAAHPMITEPAEPAMWFVGPPGPDGRRPVVRLLSLENEDRVRRRHSRWKKDGLVCYRS
jgi:hypothetical protein